MAGPAGGVDSVDTMPVASMSTSLGQRSSGRTVIDRYVWVLPVALTVAAGLWGVRGVAPWRDEMATWWAATVPAPDALRLLGNVDGVLAPYYLVMRAWLALAGDSILALRLPSLAAMVATAALVAHLGRRLFGPSAGLIAGVLFALLPGVTAYAQEARPYALATLAVTGATLLLLRALERRTWASFAAYGGTLVVAGLLHVLALAVVLGHVLAVTTAPADRGQVVRRWIVTTGLALLPVSAFAGLALSQRGQVDWLPEPTPEILIRTPAVVLGSALGAGLLLALAVVGLRLDQRTALLAGWAVVAPLALWLVSFWERVFYYRYVAFAVPAACLLAAGTIWRLGRGRDRRVLAAGALTALALAGLTAADHRDVRSSLHKQGFAYADVVAPIVAGYRAGDAVAYAEADSPYFIRLGTEYEFARHAVRPLEAFVEVPATRAGAYMPIACADVLTCRAGVADVTRIWVVRLADLGDPLAGYPPPVETVLREDFTVVATYHTRAVGYPPPLDGATVALLERR